MSSESLAESWAYRRRQFHFQTQQLYAGAVEIFRNIPFCLVPVHSHEFEATNTLIKVYGGFGDEHQVLADFAAVFEEDRGRVLPACKFTSLHAAAIQESSGFLQDILRRDNMVARQLADTAVAAGLVRDRPQWPYLYHLFEDPQESKLLRGELGRRFTELVTDRSFLLTEDQFAIIRGSDELVRTFESALRHELECSLERFTDPMEGFMTNRDIAALADVELQTVYNEISESRKLGAAPKAAELGKGQGRTKYRYSEILPWLRRMWPDKHFLDSYKEAAAIVARQAAQKVSSS